MGLSGKYDAEDPLVGKQFGMLKVMQRLTDIDSPSKNLRAQVLVQCSCGKRLRIPRYYLVRKPNPKTHCGCQGGPQPKAEPKRSIEYKPEYISWRMMQERCKNPKHVSYKDYGGRGISVCQRWTHPTDGFQNFLSDMGLKPTKAHTLDRIRVNDNYEP